MAKRIIFKTGLLILSAPLLAFSRVAEAVNLWDLRTEIDICLQAVDRNSLRPVPARFIRALAVAEDKRNALHPGVDPIGIFRAILVRVCRKEIQGASTIEQQFVRVVTGSYEMTMRRKIKEQALAVAVSRRRSKTQIASAYLFIARYGSGLNGALGLGKLCGTNLDECQAHTIYEAVARLKYPEPSHPSSAWRQKLVRRTVYIARGMPEIANQSSSGFFPVGKVGVPCSHGGSS